ncbi:DASS family sodium-coupled anion symporter [Aquabacterium fontiphilum]|uniref:SLC13 family permease n=1 Tax=Aquabacterium fontiphilum TaxID=450365 RepID=UPI0013787EFB|nr:DASS family sodium-coupled anion symporter [Aquabacterium fontiphilum]NBD20736.1 DASS family sodium-coupled anion symporter [Aquabacterium fontiphilum]
MELVWRWGVCALVALAGAWLLPGEGELRLGLWLFLVIACLWLTQAWHVTATALLVPVLAVVMGLQSPKAALAAFAHPIIFLFLGGFALAAALSRHGLDRAMATAVLRWAGGHRLRAVAMLCGLAALLSMWMSNTATAVMMLPLALGLLQPQPGVPDARPAERAFVLLALAYSASLGGVATLVGSPPNALAAAQASIGFAEWLWRAGPLALVMWPVVMGLLWLLLKPVLSGRVPMRATDDGAAPWTWTRARAMTVVIFVLAVAGWVGGAPLAAWLGVEADMDTVVALAAILALLGSGTVGWRDVEQQTQWGVLLLFGGGLALSGLMASTGASAYLADALLTALAGASLVWLLLGVVAFVVFLTELVSNTASAALLLPLLLPVGQAMGLDPVTLAVAIAVAASCAFMLPVATPPNAIVFATDQVPQATMVRCGFCLNLVCLLLIAGHAVLWA